MDIRLRSTGEILDDAGRLVLADAPLLLALSGLFTVPAAGAVLLLLSLPTPLSWLDQCILPAGTAVAILLTALGSGACQALFFRRAEGKPVTLIGCLGDACQAAPHHAAARVLNWTIPACCLAAVGAPLWLLARIAGTPLAALPPLLLVPASIVAALLLRIVLGLSGGLVHAILTEGKWSWLSAWNSAWREGQRQAGKVAVVAVGQFFLWLLATINLYMLVRVILWAGESLAGFDLALASLACSSGNPVYLLAVGLTAWLLLAPHVEACHYLLHADARARYEGLDLWYRVRRLFPVGGKGWTAAVAFLCGAATPLSAANPRLETVQAARKELAQIVREIDGKKAYDGHDWLPRLQTIAERLDEEGSTRRGRYRWFARAVDGFERKNRAGALRVLRDLDRRLALIEEALAAPPEEPAAAGAGRSKDDIRAVLPTDNTTPGIPPPQEKLAKDPENRQPVQREEPGNRPRPNNPGEIEPPSQERSNPLLPWMVAAGIAAALIVLAFLLRPRSSPSPPQPPASHQPNGLSLEALLNQVEPHGGDSPWRQADDLARAGQLLEGVRALYLAVLALLHRADLIRYAPTRTNGEYVRQLRPRENLCGPFQGLTGLFEIKWYGERSCEPADYDRCRRLAEEIRQGVSN